MKSAYELAMEKLGGSKHYSEEQKGRLAEIDSIYDARKAEARLGAEDRLKTAEVEAADQIREELVQELKRLDSKKEEDKNRVREEG